MYLIMSCTQKPATDVSYPIVLTADRANTFGRGTVKVGRRNPLIADTLISEGKGDYEGVRWEIGKD